MRKLAAALLCLLPLTAAGKELKLDLKYEGTIDSALARTDVRSDSPRADLGSGRSLKPTGPELAMRHAKGGSGRHGFGKVWADVVKLTHGSPRPGHCKR